MHFMLSEKKQWWRRQSESYSTFFNFGNISSAGELFSQMAALQ